MAEIVIELSKSFACDEIRSAFLGAMATADVYGSPLIGGPTALYLDRVDLLSVVLRKGAPVARQMEPGEPAVPMVPVLADLAIVVRLVERNALLGAPKAPMVVPIALSLELATMPGPDGTSVALQASLHDMQTLAPVGQELRTELQARVPSVAVDVPVGPLLAILPGTVRPIVRSCALKLLNDGSLALRARFSSPSEPPGSSAGPSGWPEFAALYDAPRHRAAGEAWAFLADGDLMCLLAEAAAKDEFEKSVPADFQPDGPPTATWRPDLGGIRLYGEGEVAVPVCPDFNCWYEAVVRFRLEASRKIVIETCTDAGLTGSGKAEVVLCGILLSGAAGLVGSFVGPLTSALLQLGAGVAYTVVVAEKEKEATAQARHCKSVRMWASFAGLLVERLSVEPAGLVMAGRSTRPALGNPKLDHDDTEIGSLEWVIPVCAGNEDYAPWRLENTGDVPVQIARIETIPPFEVFFDGNRWMSGAVIGRLLAPGAQREIHAFGHGRMIVYTSAGIFPIEIAERKAPLIPVLLGPDSEPGELAFRGSMQQPLTWLCTGLRHFAKFVRLPLIRRWPEPDLDGLFTPHGRARGAFRVLDLLVSGAAETVRLEALLHDGSEPRRLATVAGPSGLRHLSLRAPERGELWLAVDPGDSPAGEAEGGLRVARIGFEPAARLPLPTGITGWCLLGGRLLLADAVGLYAADLERLRRPEGRPRAFLDLRSERLLELAPAREPASLVGSGRFIHLGRDRELLTIELGRREARIVGRQELEAEVRALLFRRGRLHVLTAAGLEMMAPRGRGDQEPLARFAFPDPIGVASGPGGVLYVAGAHALIGVQPGNDRYEAASRLRIGDEVRGVDVEGGAVLLHLTSGASAIASISEAGKLAIVGRYTDGHWARGMSFRGGLAVERVGEALLVYRVERDAPDPLALAAGAA